MHASRKHPPVFVGRFSTILVALVLTASLHAAPVELINKPAPHIGSFGLEGTIPATDGKVVLLDFWASWCAPCKASFPRMAQLHRQFADQGLVIIAVSVDDDARAFARFVEKAAPPFGILRDKGHKLVAEMGVPTMPTSFLIDRKGVVRFKHTGFHGDATVEAYTSQIEKLLAESGS